MSSRKAQVGLAQGPDRRRNIYEALDRVRAEVTPRLQPQVMLKPNFLSSTNPVASSHIDAMRGAIDFLLSTPRPPQEILIAEGGNEEKSGDAFQNFGYPALQEEYALPIRLVDLNQESAWESTSIILADGSEYQVHMPKTVLNCPCTISVAIAKTHDVCVVTLALKNMIMGTIRKVDRVRMHGYNSHAERVLPTEAQVLNINLIRLARFLSPDIAIVDGAQGVQGNGPGGTDVVDFRLAAASADVFAADAVMAQAMGFAPMSLGLLKYGHDLGLGVADLAQIQILGPALESVIQPFTPHESTDLQVQWQRDDAMALITA